MVSREDRKTIESTFSRSQEIDADSNIHETMSPGSVPRMTAMPGICQDFETDVKGFSCSLPEMLSPSVQKLLGKYKKADGSIVKDIRHGVNGNRVDNKAEAGMSSSNPMHNADDIMSKVSVETATDKRHEPISVIGSPGLDDSDYISLNAMQQKYVDGEDTAMQFHHETREIAAELMSIDQEENTLELRSQIIFDRSNAGYRSISYPANETKSPSQHTEYPSKEKSILQSPDELEKAIQLALTQSKSRVSPDEVNQMRHSLSHYSCTASAKKHSSTPSIPESMPAFLPVDEAKYATLPSFIRGQLPLNLFNKAHKALYDLVSRRSFGGKEINKMGFNIVDVESATELPQGKSKVLLNALAKLDQVNLKVIYGRGAVYYFV